MGHGSVEDLYSAASSCNYWTGIDRPMVFVNALDDPILPPTLLDRVRTAASERGQLGYRPASLQKPRLFCF